MKKSVTSIPAALHRILLLAAGLLGPVVVFGALEAAFIDRLPFADASNLVVVSGVAQPNGQDYLDLLGTSRTLSAATALRFGRATLTTSLGSRRVDVLLGDSSTLAALGVAPARGRSFSRSDMLDPTSALVSQTLWEEEFGMDKGSAPSLEINGRLYQVIGVVPPALFRLGRFDVFLPRPDGNSRGIMLGQTDSFLSSILVARKHPEASLNDVQTDMVGLQRGQERPGQGKSSVGVRGLRELLTAPALPTLGTLAFAVGVLLLLSILTIGMHAAMLSVERLNEFAIRSALGASQGRLRLEAVRPWMVAMLPAAPLALVIALPLSSFVHSAMPSLGEVPVVRGETALMVFVLGLLLAGVAAIATLIPQQVAGRTRLGTGSPFAAGRASWPGGILATAQVALSVALLCGATVAMRGLADQTSRDLGLRANGVQALEIDLGEGRTPEDARAAWSALGEATSAWRGRITLGSSLPWKPPGSWWMASPSNEAGIMVGTSPVGSDFFSVLEIRFVEGVDPFSSGANTSDVVISEDTARLLKVHTGSLITVNRDQRRVAGVVATVADPANGPGSAWPRAYLMAGAEGRPLSSATVLFRGSAREAVLVRSMIERALPRASISEPAPLVGHLAGRLRRQRMGATVLAGYAILATFLVISALHGLMRKRVAERKREVGLRLSLGASPSQIDRTMLSALTGPAFLGIGLGAVLGLSLSRGVAAVMPWARPLEASTYLACILGGIAVILVSAWPALRVASRVRPADLLREG
jgi:ABC-type antimicrobial peptide transport system permease subunit